MNKRDFLKAIALNSIAAGAVALNAPSAIAKAMLGNFTPFELPKLPYSFDAFEPFIDKQTMEIHYGKHHAAYIDKLNAALKTDVNYNGQDLTTIFSNMASYSLAIRNNGGGHFNHSMYWAQLSPSAKKAPEGKLASDINTTFGSLDKFKDQFKKEALARFGSGWAWLVVNKAGKLEIVSTANQDNPLMNLADVKRGTPLLGIDVWEHAYYLKYQNKRADYLDAIWNVFDWAVVEKRYNK